MFEDTGSPFWWNKGHAFIGVLLCSQQNNYHEIKLLKYMTSSSKPQICALDRGWDFFLCCFTSHTNENHTKKTPATWLHKRNFHKPQRTWPITAWGGDDCQIVTLTKASWWWVGTFWQMTVSRRQLCRLDYNWWWKIILVKRTFRFNFCRCLLLK